MASSGKGQKDDDAVPSSKEPRAAIDPRLTAIVVAGVTGVFVLSVIVGLITGRELDPAWFVLMGGVAGGVLSYGVLRRD